MSYDPARLTTRDEIRFLATDTNPEAEICQDVEYDVSIAKYEDWRYAAAEMIEAVADRIDQRRISTTVPGDFAQTWSASQTKGLREKAKQLRMAADADAAAEQVSRQPVRMQVRYRTGDREVW